MSFDETIVTTKEELRNFNIEQELNSICDDLKEIGYEPKTQIISYLISGDPGYISSYNDCRNRITEFKREEIIEAMIDKFIDR